MTEAIEGRSSIATMMTINSKNGGPGSPTVRVSKKSFQEDVYSTFSSPLAWILVLALIITWSCVFIIIFDLMDYNTLSGDPHPGIRKVWKDSHRGGLHKISSDPLKLVNDAVEESTNTITTVLKFAANLIAPEEDDGNPYTVRKKGEFLPSRSKVLEMQVKKPSVAAVVEEKEKIEKKRDKVEATVKAEEDVKAEQMEEEEEQKEYIEREEKSKEAYEKEKCEEEMYEGEEEGKVGYKNKEKVKDNDKLFGVRLQHMDEETVRKTAEEHGVEEDQCKDKEKRVDKEGEEEEESGTSKDEEVGGKIKKKEAEKKEEHCGKEDEHVPENNEMNEDWEEQREDEMQTKAALIDENDAAVAGEEERTEALKVRPHEDQDEKEEKQLTPALERANVVHNDDLEEETATELCRYDDNSEHGEKRKTLITDNDFVKETAEEPTVDVEEVSSGLESDALVDANKNDLSLSKDDGKKSDDGEYDNESSDNTFAVSSDLSESFSGLSEEGEEDDNGNGSSSTTSDHDSVFAEVSDNVLSSDLPFNAFISKDEEKEDARKEDLFPFVSVEAIHKDVEVKAVDSKLDIPDLHQLEEKIPTVSSKNFGDDDNEEENFKHYDLNEDIPGTFKNAEINDYNENSFDPSKENLHYDDIKEEEDNKVGILIKSSVSEVLGDDGQGDADLQVVERSNGKTGLMADFSSEAIAQDPLANEDFDKTLLEFMFGEEKETESLDINEDKYDHKDEVTESSSDEDDSGREDDHDGAHGILLTAATEVELTGQEDTVKTEEDNIMNGHELTQGETNEAGASHLDDPEEERKKEEESDELLTKSFKSVDESAEKKELDEDGKQEKGTVHVIEPVAEAVVEVPQIEPTDSAETKCSTKTKATKVAPRRVSAVKRKKEQEAFKTGDKPERQALPRIVGLKPKVMKTERIAPLFKAKILKTKTTKTEEEHKQEKGSSQEGNPCTPARVYCPSPPGWYVHHIVTDNPYPPPIMPVSSAPFLTAHPGVPSAQPPYQHQTPPPVQPLYAHHQPYQSPGMPPQNEPAQSIKTSQPQASEQGTPVQPEIQDPASKNQPNAAEVHDPEQDSQPTLETRPEADGKANATSKAKEEKNIGSSPEPANTRPKSTKRQKKELESEDETSKNKKSGQRYFQCIYFPGKKAEYPLQPFTPAMSPAMLSPALKLMLERQRAARTSGQ